MEPVQIPIGLIAEYVALASSLTPASPADHYIAANRLLFQLAMTLPAGLFRVVRSAALSGDPEAIFEAMIAVRATIGTLGNLEVDDAVLHRTITDIKRLH